MEENVQSLWVPLLCLKSIICGIPAFSPNLDLVASVNSNVWWGCVSPRPMTTNCLTVGPGKPLDDLRGHLSGSDADPVTLDIVKTFPTGWKNLPQELVDEILTYLKDDFLSLVSCSGSCKALFCSTRPLIHRTLCLGTGISIDRRRRSARNRAQLDGLRLAERAQVLQYTAHLIIRLGSDFVPENLRPHLQYFHAMRGITSLEIDLPDARHFLPTFDEYFGHIAPTLRSLFLTSARDPVENLFHFVCRFPLLRDLGLATAPFPRSKLRRPPTPSNVTTPPPLDGTLEFRDTYPTISFIRSIANAPGGIYFRSVEMQEVREAPLQVIVDACSNTLESITFGTSFREYPRFRIVSRTGTYPVHKRKLTQISGIVLFSNGSGSGSSL